MDAAQAYGKIIRILLDELEKTASENARITELEQWKQDVESVWPLIGEDNGAD